MARTCRSLSDRLGVTAVYNDDHLYFYDDTAVKQPIILELTPEETTQLIKFLKCAWGELGMEED